jgi:hypothetical protein
MSPVQDSLEMRTVRTSDMDEETRESVVRLCIDAHREEDFQNLFSYLPPEGLHVLAYLDDRLVAERTVTMVGPMFNCVGIGAGEAQVAFRDVELRTFDGRLIMKPDLEVLGEYLGHADGVHSAP